MQALLIVFHIIACMALILIVLLQTGRGAEMGAAFGGSSQTLFGSTGTTTFLGKMTTLAAVLFMVTCLGLTYFSGRPHTQSIMENVQVPERPAIPEAQPVAPASPVPPAATSQVPGTAPAASQSAAAPSASTGAGNPAPAAAQPAAQ
ncbi:MAG: preprotein translocase subunit SecG [Syntrophobacteraceae bacterium CG2_30_61_12]|nr:MAG: preprotein translocase subunit SecG [Syntrophobacteraceae bacterium CG2_30_61_12]PIU31770.1 MAG: preprotein translocase subunit SecG [Syntrophobacteraceae bacterium CG07_land_8_20_14_0_80_61_8]